MVTKDKTSPSGQKSKSLRVTSSREGFRRAGFVFGKDPVTIALSELNPGQIAQLNDDSMLNITEIEAAV